MKKGMLIAVISFLVGGFVGMNVASLFWKKLVEDGVLGQASSQVCQALAPLKWLHQGKTKAAMSILQQQVELGLSCYQMHHAMLRKGEPMPDIFSKAKTLLEETQRETSRPNEASEAIGAEAAPQPQR